VRPEPIFAVPFLAFAAATMGAVSVGLGRRLVREFADLARAKVPSMGTGRVADQPVVRHRVARAVGALRAAATHLDDRTRALWDTVTAAGGTASARGEALAPVVADLQLAATHAVATGVDAAHVVHDLSGMTALEVQPALTRVVADLAAASQNAVVSSARFEDAGTSLLA
jgi:hypothetical protein